MNAPIPKQYDSNKSASLNLHCTPTYLHVKLYGKGQNPVMSVNKVKSLLKTYPVVTASKLLLSTQLKVKNTKHTNLP